MWRGRRPGQFAGESKQRDVAGALLAPGLRRGHELGGQDSSGGGDTGAAGGGGDDAEILVVQFLAEAGREGRAAL